MRPAIVAETIEQPTIQAPEIAVTMPAADPLHQALAAIEDALTTATGEMRERLLSMQQELNHIATIPLNVRTPAQAMTAQLAPAAVQRVVNNENNRDNTWDRAVFNNIMIASLSDEARARIGLRSMSLTDDASYRAFASTFFDDMPEDLQGIFSEQLANILQNTPEGQALAQRFNAVSMEGRAEVAAAEEITREQAEGIASDSSVAPDTQAVVATAVTDQGLADPETAAAIERIDGDRRAGRRPRTEDVETVRQENDAREGRMAGRLNQIIGGLPEVLQPEVRDRGARSPREVIREGRAVAQDEQRREGAMAVLRALEDNPGLTREELLQRGFTNDQIRDAAFLNAYAVARGVEHVQDIVERGEECDRRRGLGPERGDRTREPSQGYTPVSERLKIGQSEIDQLWDSSHFRFADANGNNVLDRPDIDRAIANLQAAGVTVDLNGNGRLDANEIGNLETQMNNQAQLAQTSQGRTGPG